MSRPKRAPVFGRRDAMTERAERWAAAQGYPRDLTPDVAEVQGNVDALMHGADARRTKETVAAYQKAAEHETKRLNARAERR